ncbi:hypothetical protein CRG98_001631 [Punica granatum]|uniref:Uncharacterized protein n=1 Tax=Punica granatum TaxID=22663 RepID=A0A2I0LBH0_PUNGR|nr:hypothetical protein CRG98_001631 [Punica granatum]
MRHLGCCSRVLVISRTYSQAGKTSGIYPCPHQHPSKILLRRVEKLFEFDREKKEKENLFLHQYKLLLKKNLLLSWQSKRSMFFQLSSSSSSSSISLFFYACSRKLHLGSHAEGVPTPPYQDLLGYGRIEANHLPHDLHDQFQVMTLRDLLDSAYWLSWLTSDRIIILISSLFTVLFRMMSQFDFFLNNSFTVVFLLLFLFQFNMIGFSFMLPAFLSESASSSMIGFYIFIAGYLQEQLMKFGFPYNTSSSNMHRTIWSLFPPNLLTKAVKLLADATSTLVILESVGRAARNVLQMIPSV